MNSTSEVKLRLSVMDTELRKAFGVIKEELEDHRISINENTEEITSQHEGLMRLESKLDRLQERVDEMSLFLMDGATHAKPTVSELTEKEKEVFMTIYTAEHKQLSYCDIAGRHGITQSMAIYYVNNLVAKGVPISTHFSEGRAVLKLEESFKQLQAKENVLSITSGQVIQQALV